MSLDNRDPDSVSSSDLRAEIERKKQEERELGKFSEEIKSRPISELERDSAEMTYEIELLEKQLTAGLGEYSPRDLELGYAKVAFFKKKFELMKLEIENRKNKARDGTT